MTIAHRQVVSASAVLLICAAAATARAGSGTVFDVTTFGAIANDGLDDSAAISAAIAAAAPGSTVYLPAGTFSISSSIVPQNGVRIAGAGRDSTVIEFIGSSPSAMVQMQSSTSNQAVELSGFTLDGKSNVNAVQGIVGSNGGQHHIHGLRVANLVSGPNFGPHGIYFSQNVVGSQITGNEFINIGVDSVWGGGVRISNGSNDNRVVGNTVQNTGRGGILVDASTTPVIQNNTINGSGLAPGGPGLGIEVWGGSHGALIEDNVIDHWLSVDSSNYSAVRRNTVSNTSGPVKFIGLELAGSVDVIFTDNVVDRGAHIGISTSNDAPKQRVFWGYNSISGAETWGAQIQGDESGVQQMVFYENTFEQTNAGAPYLYSGQGHGFRVNGNTQHLVLDSNRFVDNDGMGIQLGGGRIDQLEIINNTIAGNGGAPIRDSFGSSLWYLGSDLVFENNSIYDNGFDQQFFFSQGFAGNQKPLASIISSDIVPLGEAVDFSFSFADDGYVANVLWDFDEGVPQIDHQPSFTFTRLGTHRVTLLVWDDGGRVAHDEFVVMVVPEPSTALLGALGLFVLLRYRIRAK